MTDESQTSRGSTAGTGAADSDRAQPDQKTSGRARTNGQGNDRQALAAEVEQTRQELGETVDALAGKADVGSRARHKAAHLREQATSSLGTLTRTVRRKAPQVRDQVAVPVAKAAQAIPEPARGTAVRTTQRTAQAASRRPGVLWAPAAACVVAGVWLWRRGSSS